MQMKMTYLPVEHQDLPPGSSAEAFDPNAGVITTELNTALYNKHLNEMGAEGWQLLSVQAVHKVEYTHIQNVSVIGGFYFFWQKSATNTESLAFPMTSPSFPGIQAAPVNNFASSVNSKQLQDLTTKPIIRPTGTNISNENINPKPTESNESVQEPASKPKLETRVSTIKKLLEEKSSKNPHASKNAVEIPPEANTQLLRNIEDIHNLKHASKVVGSSKKPSPELKPKVENSAKEPDTTHTTDAELDADFDLDFDLDFEDAEKNNETQPD